MNISSTSRWWRGGKLVLPQLGTEQVISDLLPVEMQRFCQNIISRYVKSEVRFLVPVKLKFQQYSVSRLYGEFLDSLESFWIVQTVSILFHDRYELKGATVNLLQTLLPRCNNIPSTIAL